MDTRSKILDTQAISKKINRIAWQIYEDNIVHNEIVIVGVCGRGEVLACMISKIIHKISPIKTILATINLDKDKPYLSQININLNTVDYTNKVVIVVDDVLNSGKTLMYATKYFLTTPLIKLSTAVLIDRTHNRFPIKADFVGLALATTLHEYVTVVLDGDIQGVYLS